MNLLLAGRLPVVTHGESMCGQRGCGIYIGFCSSSPERVRVRYPVVVHDLNPQTCWQVIVLLITTMPDPYSLIGAERLRTAVRWDSCILRHRQK